MIRFLQAQCASVAARAALTTAILLALCAAPTLAVNANALITGTVTDNGSPAADVVVTASGNDLTLKTKTDARGRFAFPPLALGSYDITVAEGDLQGRARVDLGTGGANVAIVLEGVKAIGHVVVVGSPPTHGSGTDETLNSTTLSRLPYANFAEMEIQMPAAARGANGVVHMNGDHGVINYMLDGVPIPQELNRDIGAEIDMNDLSFVDLIEGAYPAQYGMRFGAVYNMSTRAGTGPPGFDYSASGGSYTDLNSTLGYHAPIPGGGGFDVAFSGFETTRGLDPPEMSSPHNDASSTNQFARFTLPGGGGDFTNVTMIHSHATFQIPDDVTEGEPASTDDNEDQDDTYLAVQFHHPIGSNGLLSFGPAFKSSTIQDFGDEENDFIYGEALDQLPPPYGNAGSSAADCAQNPNPNFTPTTCAFSLADNRTAVDDILQSDYTQSFGAHSLAAGVSYDLTHVDKTYAVTLQPDNFISTSPVTVVDDSPNLGNTYQSYVQDSWRLDQGWEADYGMRYDYFTIRSTQFYEPFGQFSPRLKLTHYIGQRASVYAYIGRFFEPFSFENVSPAAAQELNEPLQRSIAQFDLKPERDTNLEVGGHLPLGSGDLGWRVWQKNANDLIDDTQVGVTLLHQDINYVLGRISEEAVDFTQPSDVGRFYFSAAHVVSLNKGCETQLLAPCFGSPTDFTPADHEQNWSITSGLLRNDDRGGWFSFDGEYGSGLSSAVCPITTPGNCKMTPHTIFDVEKAVAIAPHTALTFGIQNLLNDRYYVTLLNAQGNHFAAPREFTTGFRVTM